MCRTRFHSKFWFEDRKLCYLQAVRYKMFNKCFNDGTVDPLFDMLKHRYSLLNTTQLFRSSLLWNFHSKNHWTMLNVKRYYYSIVCIKWGTHNLLSLFWQRISLRYLFHSLEKRLRIMLQQSFSQSFVFFSSFIGLVNNNSFRLTWTWFNWIQQQHSS